MIAKKIQNRISWVADSLIWLLLRPFYRPAASQPSPVTVTIGITTFMDRYENYFKPLLKKLICLFPENQIIVIANGHIFKDKQHAYVEKIKAFCNKYDNVDLITYIEPEGLSHLWNEIINRSNSSQTLILNDDIKIRRSFRNAVTDPGFISNGIATINSSWSHFLISRKIFEDAGPFDEGFKEIGGEDDDYLARLAILGLKPGNFLFTSIAGRRRKKGYRPAVNSYGRDMSKEKGGYSTLNAEYLFQKWETSDVYFEGAVEVKGRRIRYWKRREKKMDEILRSGEDGKSEG